jgi:hypothetical protein
VSFARDLWFFEKTMRYQVPGTQAVWGILARASPHARPSVGKEVTVSNGSSRDAPTPATMATVKKARHQRDAAHQQCDCRTQPHNTMNKQSPYAATAPPPPQQQPPTAAAAPSAGSSTDDHPEVSSCFVSSPSSSTSSSAFMGTPSRYASAGALPTHHQEQPHSRMTQHHPLHSVLQEPRQGGLLFPHLSHLGSDDDSLRVSSSTLFHDGATTTAESNVTTGNVNAAAPDSPIAETQCENHLMQQQEKGSAPLSTPTRVAPAGEPLHNDVYECLCSPAAASNDSDSDSNQNGVGGGGGGLFAPRHFKRRLADTLLERMRSRADTTSAMMAIEVETDQAPHLASGESRKRTFHSTLHGPQHSFPLRSTLPLTCSFLAHGRP